MAREVKLVKGPEGLGIALRTVVLADVVWPKVHSVRPGSEAALSGLVAVGDRIETVNGFRVVGKTHHFVKDLLQLVPVGSTVEFRLVDPIDEDEYDSSGVLSFQKRLFPSQTNIMSSSLNGPSLSHEHHMHPMVRSVASVRRSQSDCHKMRPPIARHVNLSRVQSVHSNNPWEVVGGQTRLRQSSEFMSSSGLGDSISSLTSLSRQDTSERWPECGQYTATGTDLHKAVVREDVTEVERLLKIGSSIYSLDSEGDTPLDLASRCGNINILKLMEELYEGSTISSSSSSSGKEHTTDNHKPGHKKSRHKADVRKELAKAYENIGSKV